MVFATFLVLLAPIAWSLSGEVGVLALALAVVSCLISGWATLVATRLIGDPQEQPLLHVGVGMISRFAIPMAAVLIVLFTLGELREAGFAWYLVAAFLLGLLVETAISVGELKSSAS
jgi:hypothetical protein